MAAKIALYELAHCRAGDKGDDCILALIPYSRADYGTLCEVLTEHLIREHFSAREDDQVSIVQLPYLSAMVIEVRGRLSGGVTRSTGADPHGKTLSSHLLELRVGWPAAPPQWRIDDLECNSETKERHR